MKKTLAVTAVLGLAVAAQAGLVNWSSGNYGLDAKLGTVGAGAIVGLYIDVNGDNNGFAGWQNAGLVVNTDLTVNTGTGVLADDVFAGFTTTMQNPAPPVKLLSPLFDFNVVPDNAQIYSVAFDAATLVGGESGIILDAATFDSGAAAPPATSTAYTLGPIGAGNMGGVTVIPEPATIGLMGVAGLGMFLARRKARS